jgi:MFS family permease
MSTITSTITGSKPKFNAGIVWLIGLAVFAQEISWNFYDSQVPVSLGKYINSVGVVGFIMGLDNLLGIIIQPIMGNLSDNTRTRWGRRMPYIMVGIPLAAIFFLMISFETSLPMLMTFIILYITVMLGFKAPTESLMPDFVPAEHRSKGNSILKIITSLTVIIAAIISMLFVDKNLQLAFFIPSALMLITLPFLMSTVKEKNSDSYQEVLREESRGPGKAPVVEKVKLMPTFLNIIRSADKSRLWMLLAIFSASIAWASIRALLTRYGMEQLGMSRGDAGGLTLPGGIAFFLFAYPVALLSEKYGRKLLMYIGLGVMIVGLVLGFALQSETFLMVAVVLVSIGWASTAINAIVIVWNMAATTRTTGTYTGLYYFFYYAGAAFGPGIVGTITDMTGWRPFLLNVGVFAVLAIVLLVFVKNNKS